jgi:hypothetical protein
MDNRDETIPTGTTGEVPLDQTGRRRATEDAALGANADPTLMTGAGDQSGTAGTRADTTIGSSPMGTTMAQAGLGQRAAYGEDAAARMQRERSETHHDDERRRTMDNERTTPEGDTDDMLLEMTEMETVRGEENIRGESGTVETKRSDETGARTKDQAIPSSYGASGGLTGGSGEKR